MGSIYKYFINFFKITDLAKMSAQIDCPICMDCIETNKNCVTTECGHSFHASCLMQNVAHNGFGCPYCRTALADEPEEEPEEDDVEWSDDEEEEEEIEMYDDDALRGFRFFFNNLVGESHDEEDIVEENEFELAMAETDEENSSAPSISFVAQKLQEQGITYDKLIHMICNMDHDEFSEGEIAERFSNELFGKIRVIVSNYQPPSQGDQAVPPIPTPVTPVSEPVSRPTPVLDYEAQPKTTQVRQTPTFMVHIQIIMF